jgi:pantetheine-phosphate adenylyltransferase
MTERVGVYPGTFDPITSGHIDIIQRASKLVDRLIVGVARNAGKNPLLGLDERVELVQAETSLFSGRNGHGAIEVTAFSSLLMHFAEQHGASLIIRGLRAVSDFEYEFQMAGMNAKLNPAIETAFLMAADGQHFVSSRFVKEIGRLGGDISRFVTPRVAERLKQAFAANPEAQAAAAKQTPSDA